MLQKYFILNNIPFSIVFLIKELYIMKFSFFHRYRGALCRRLLTGALALSLCGALALSPVSVSEAAKKKTKAPTAAEIAAAEEAEAARQAAYNKTIETNSIENWPQGPQIYAESAIVMEASTGTILYGKDIDAANYPASITKIMTALVVLENCSLDEVVTYSYNAVNTIEAGSSSIGTLEGEELTVEQSLYALLLASANECANGLAEHVAGSNDAFVELMNAKAAQLGCTNTHFANPHGLHNDNHYTSAHDMALIMQAALQNDDFVRISGTDKYQIPVTNKYNEIRYLVNHHYMIGPYKGVTSYLDDTVIAGKTGYTSMAQCTLVTAAERNGMTLIVVTMKTANKGDYFSDTALLLNYAGENFTKWNVADNETNFSVVTSNSFYTGSAIFGSAQPLIEISSDSSIVLPASAAFSDASADLIFNNDETNTDLIATLQYSYSGQSIGKACLLLDTSQLQEFAFQTTNAEGTETAADSSTDTANTNAGTNTSANEAETTDTKSAKDESAESGIQQTHFILINVRVLLCVAIGLLFLLLLLLFIRRLSRNFRLGVHFAGSGSRYQHSRSKKRRRKKKKSSARYQRTPKRREDKSSMNDLDL